MSLRKWDQYRWLMEGAEMARHVQYRGEGFSGTWAEYLDKYGNYGEAYLRGHCHPPQGADGMRMFVAPGAKCIYAGCHGIIQRTEVFPVEGTQIAGQEYLCSCGARWVNWLAPTSTKLLTKRDFVPGQHKQAEFRDIGRPLKTDEALTKQQVRDKIDSLEKELDLLRRRG